MESQNPDKQQPITLAQRAIHLKKKNGGWIQKPVAQIRTPNALPPKAPGAKTIIVQKYLDPTRAWALNELLILNGGDPRKGLN